MVDLRRTNKYRLYHSKNNRHLHEAINTAGAIWNYCVEVQRHNYAEGSGYVSTHTLMQIVAVLRRKHFPAWKKVGSQAVQDVVQRLDRA